MARKCTPPGILNSDSQQSNSRNTMTSYHRINPRALRPMLAGASAAIAVLRIATCAAATPEAQ
jgi:hypothetical protein